MPFDVHVVSHTHWDREWYHTAGRFRQRLVALIDELLDDPPRPGESFLLDGQAIVLEDYLAVRPERRERLVQLLGDGRIEAGPWFVLGDDLIPGGEALVRNLLAGRRVLQRLGAVAPPVLYCPDSFGHPAMLPELATGFGIPVAIVWRGLGGRRRQTSDVVEWRSPGGASVLVFHLPPGGYEVGSSLPTGPDAAAARWRELRGTFAARSALAMALLPNGADHHARQRDLRAAVQALASAASPDSVHVSSMREFVSALTDRAARAHVGRITGELRDSYGYTWTLQGTFGTRAHQKREHARAERLLVRDVEPWLALTARRGSARAPLVQAAWRDLLEAEPHDTLCGTSIDDVALAFDARVASAISQAQGLREDALLDLVGHDPERARTSREQWQPVTIVRNRAARPRGGVAEIEVLEFVADVPVGPGSAPLQPLEPTPATPVRLDGARAVQVLGAELRHDRTESPRHYPDNDLVRATRVLAWVPEVPGYGTRSFAQHGEGKFRNAVPDPVRVSKQRIENGHTRLTIGADGSLSLESIADGRRFDDLLLIEDCADIGDLYTPAIREPVATPRFLGARVSQRGPLRGEVELRWRLVDLSGKRATATLTTRVSLDAGSPLLRVEVEGENQSNDHRVRLGFRTRLIGPAVWADAAFGPVQRARLEVAAEDAAMEIPIHSAPLHRYVSVFQGSAGATVLSDGLAEYEAAPSGDLWITLVRAVGELSRNDLPERPGHAGWPVPTPLAQSHGPFAATLALMIHGGRTESLIANIEHAAEDFLLPLTGRTLRSAIGDHEPTTGVELIGDGLAFSAMKESEDGSWTVVRCVNLLDRDVRGAMRFGFDVAEARLARLDETPLGELEVRQGREVPVVAGARAVVTVLVRQG